MLDGEHSGKFSKKFIRYFFFWGITLTNDRIIIIIDKVTMLIIITFWIIVSRWMAAVKVSHGASKDMVAAAGKADALKAQYEEETNKFAACQVSNIISYLPCWKYM